MLKNKTKQKKLNLRRKNDVIWLGICEKKGVRGFLLTKGLVEY